MRDVHQVVSVQWHHHIHNILRLKALHVLWRKLRRRRPPLMHEVAKVGGDGEAQQEHQHQQAVDDGLVVAEERKGALQRRMNSEYSSVVGPVDLTGLIRGKVQLDWTSVAVVTESPVQKDRTFSSFPIATVIEMSRVHLQRYQQDGSTRQTPEAQEQHTNKVDSQGYLTRISHELGLGLGLGL